MEETLPEIELAVDESILPTRSDTPFAVAVYHYDSAHPGGRYIFRGVKRVDGRPFTVEFDGGPVAGQRDSGQPAVYGPSERYIPLSESGEEFDGNAEPSAVAIYERERHGNEWKYVFSHIEESGEKLESARSGIARSHAKGASRNFYLRPDYNVYSKPPMSDHKQLFIEYGKRRAHVDEKIAPLILEVWKRGLETGGSCEERPSGRAYIGFPVPGEGGQYHDLLREHEIDAELQSTTIALKNVETGGILKLPASNVLFWPHDITRITELLQRISSN